MPKTSLHAFKAKDTRFVADWLKSKSLHKLFSVFEGIQEPFILYLACKSVVLNHVYIHSFRSIIKATEKFPGGEGIWSPGMDLWWGIWTAFRPREGGILTKILQKIQMPGGCPGGDVEASIWLVHKFLLFVSICVPPNNPITACGANFVPRLSLFSKVGY